MRFSGEAVVAAPREHTWLALADIASHVEWMADAESIAFATAQRRGVGTTFECHTRVGPLRTRDRMTVTEWVEGTRIAVAHTGIVTGVGVFDVLSESAETSCVSWTEELSFPLWAGGPIGAFAAKPVLRRVWRGNLSRFKALVEASYRKN